MYRKDFQKSFPFLVGNPQRDAEGLKKPLTLPITDFSYLHAIAIDLSMCHNPC